MRIEKISENQIRCTLSKKDLTERELKISELAYGSEKAKALFHDMMQQASYQFGFEAEDIPLMIEAIPISKETLVLVITKVEDPDELDTRFSKFSPDYSQSEADDEDEESYADEILQRFDQLNDLLQDKEDAIAEEEDVFIPLPEALGIEKKEYPNVSKPDSISPPVDITKIYSFRSLDEIIKLAEHTVYFYHGVNSVYKNLVTSKYYLVLRKSSHTPEEFNKICNMVSEYGKQERSTYATASYFEEHFEAIVKTDAIQILSVM